MLPGLRSAIHRRPTRWSIAASALFALACSGGEPVPEAPPAPVGEVVVEPLGSDVWAAIRQEPEGYAVNGNSLFIVGDEDVIVVDAQFTRAATLENLAALRRITGKPVGLVLITHWHDDHVAGAQVYRDTFPDVRFLATPETRADLIAMGRPNREGQLRFGPPTLARFQRLLDTGLGADSTPVSPLERESLASAIAIFGRYVDEAPEHREVLPDTLEGRTATITRGGRTIELRWFGRGNTRGDLVTWLPAERIVATGDLLVAPVPFGFNSYPSEWIAVLDSIEALGPAVLVPGHGPVMRDLEYLSTVRAMLTEARDRTGAMVQAGVPSEAMADSVRLESWRARLAGDEKWMNVLFNQFFRVPVVGRLDAELRSGTGG